MPAKPWKKDGSYSSHMVNFIEKHQGKVLEDNKIEFYGKVYSIVGKLTLDVKLPMVIGDQQHFKQWLLDEQNWQPTFWNFQKDAKGKPVKDEKNQLILTSPKLQEAGVICPNLLSLEGPLVKEVVKFLSLRNRLSVITSWINNPRLEYDNRIGASATKIATSHRQCHSVICNVPRAGGGSLYGDEFRKLFCAQNGNVIVGADSSGLEQRCAGHMTFKYDGGATLYIPSNSLERIFFSESFASTRLAKLSSSSTKSSSVRTTLALYSGGFSGVPAFWKALAGSCT